MKAMATKPKANSDILPNSLPPRGLSRVTAAAYLGIGIDLFDRLVADGTMPKPKRIYGRLIWDRIALDVAFVAICDDSGKMKAHSEWDEVS